MNCPACLSIMYNKHHITELSPELSLMRLHCWNDECPARLHGYQSHMAVHVRPNEQWVCTEYHLPFQYREKWYAMVGEPFIGYLGFPYHSFWKPLPDKQTTIYEIVKKPDKSAYIYMPVTDLDGEMVSVPFIPLSTDNDMHERAKHLFGRLIKLVAFS